MARRSVSVPRAGPRGSGRLFLTHPELLIPGAAAVSSQPRMCFLLLTVPKALTLKHKRYSVLYVCIAVQR